MCEKLFVLLTFALKRNARFREKKANRSNIFASQQLFLESESNTRIRAAMTWYRKKSF